MVRLSELCEELKYLNYNYKIESSNRVKIIITDRIDIDIHLDKDYTSIFCGALGKTQINHFISDDDNDIHEVMEKIEELYEATIGIIKTVLKDVKKAMDNNTLKLEQGDTIWV